jgi:hypothetical protein
MLVGLDCLVGLKDEGCKLRDSMTTMSAATFAGFEDFVWFWFAHAFECVECVAFFDRCRNEL